MWLEILCCFVVYILFRLFFKDDVLDIETSDFDAITSVAARYFLTIPYHSSNFKLKLGNFNSLPKTWLYNECCENTEIEHCLLKAVFHIYL